MAQACRSPTLPNLTTTHLRQKDEKGLSVIGAVRQVSCTDTRARIVCSPTNVATDSNQDGASSPTTMEGIIRSLTPPKPVPITGIMRMSSSPASMPRRNRLNTNENGPNAFGWDSPVQGWGTGQMNLVVADSVTEAETRRRMGCGVLSEDSRLDLSSRTGSRPWTRGDDMILTPFSLSPTTDTAVDSLPILFLAYYTLADSDDVMSDDD
jgi:hypothetical protein